MTHQEGAETAERIAAEEKVGSATDGGGSWPAGGFSGALLSRGGICKTTPIGSKSGLPSTARFSS